MSKRELRKKILTARDELGKEDIWQRSQRIQEQLFREPGFQNAKTVLFFHTMRSEVDTRPMIAAALTVGKRVALPRCAGGELELRQVNSLDDDLAPGMMGILEPRESCPLVPDAEVELVVVPAVAWDQEGYRTGYGGGYYDRLLARLPQAARIGIGFELQVVSRVPREAHDLPVDVVITERETRRFKRQSG